MIDQELQADCDKSRQQHVQQNTPTGPETVVAK